MPYVMVPVPEEHVEDVMQFVLRSVARASLESWDAPAIQAVWNELDEISKSLLSAVARSTLGGSALSLSDAGSAIQHSAREAVGVVRELNDLELSENRPPLVGIRTVSETQANGRIADTKVFSMSEEVSALIQEAERIEMQNAPDPLAG